MGHQKKKKDFGLDLCWTRNGCLCPVLLASLYVCLFVCMFEDNNSAVDVVDSDVFNSHELLHGTELRVIA